MYRANWPHCRASRYDTYISNFSVFCLHWVDRMKQEIDLRRWTTEAVSLGTGCTVREPWTWYERKHLQVARKHHAIYFALVNYIQDSIASFFPQADTTIPFMPYSFHLSHQLFQLWSPNYFFHGILNPLFLPLTCTRWNSHLCSTNHLKLFSLI